MPDRDNPKTEDKYKDVKPKIKQVFDSLNMPHSFEEEEKYIVISDVKNEGCENDSYHRWYPEKVDKKDIGAYCDFDTEQDWKAAKALNDWLLAHGMEIKEEFCFHVLIHVSW